LCGLDWAEVNALIKTRAVSKKTTGRIRQIPRQPSYLTGEELVICAIAVLTCAELDNTCGTALPAVGNPIGFLPLSNLLWKPVCKLRGNCQGTDLSVPQERLCVLWL
ncbi:MAG TPA: hypothetical protein VKQ89_04355, partial [Candidatus Angelobacter sp.]|nr:hypothetical protein [Candidatus Angelobacter sp.]